MLNITFHAKAAKQQKPLLVWVDFEKGKLNMEVGNRYVAAKRSTQQNKQLKISADIFYSHPVDLAVEKPGNIVFYIEGDVDDGVKAGRCSGICVIDEGLNINFSFSIRKHHGKEINFTIPVTIKSNAA